MSFRSAQFLGEDKGRQMQSYMSYNGGEAEHQGVTGEELTRNGRARPYSEITGNTEVAAKNSTEGK